MKALAKKSRENQRKEHNVGYNAVGDNTGLRNLAKFSKNSNL